MAASIPSALKSTVGSLVARANELEHVEPAIAYWIRYWMVQKVVDTQKQNRSAEVDTFLVEVLEQLEAMKTKYPALVEINSSSAGKQKVESFALTVFANADEEERAKVANKGTALKFLAAGVFLEVCKAFGEPRKEIVDKRKYAKVQAMRIQSAIAAGKDPNVGKTSMAPEAIEDATAAEQQELDALLQGPTGEVLPQASQLDIRSQKIIESVPGPVNIEAEAPPTELSAIQSPRDASTDIPSNPYFPSLEDVGTPLVGLDMADNTAIDVESSPDMPEVVSAVSSPKQKHVRSSSQVKKAVVFIPESEAMEAAQKHAKFAISALNYEDVSTAVLELQKALHRLQG